MGPALGVLAVAVFVLGPVALAEAAPATPTPAQQQWALAVSAILTQQNGQRHDLLAGEVPTPRAVRHWKGVLQEWWGIESRADLDASLDWLARGGHRAEFERLGATVQAVSSREWEALLARRRRDDPDAAHQLAMARTYYRGLGEKSLFGWDFARYVSLCRWGYLVGYLSEEEAWQRIIPAARFLQGRFDSWRDLGRNYLVGREFWSREEMRRTGHLYRRAYRDLLDRPDSPWNRLPWTLPLD